MLVRDEHAWPSLTRLENLDIEFVATVFATLRASASTSLALDTHDAAVARLSPLRPGTACTMRTMLQLDLGDIRPVVYR
jgi:hypothetical protein